MKKVQANIYGADTDPKKGVNNQCLWRWASGTVVNRTP